VSAFIFGKMLYHSSAAADYSISNFSGVYNFDTTLTSFQHWKVLSGGQTTV
jgi:hypothetical protein